MRFRKFNDPPGFELFVGVHAPTPAAGRDVTWDLSAPNSVTFTYAPLADTLSAGVANAKPGSPFNQTFVNYALAAVPPAVSGDFVPADMNVMVITLTLESTMPVASTLRFEGVTLDGNQLGHFAAAGAGVFRWTVTDFDFGAGFALAGAVKVSGPFSGCDECSKLEISVGHLNVCGDGDIDPDGAFGTAEDCEDGNAVGGDCCSATCQFEGAGSACPVDTCDPVDGCASTGVGPAPGCRTASKSLLVVNQSANDAKDKLIWRWIKGASTVLAEIADPIGEADYSLCLYDGPGGALVASAEVVHGTNWRSLGAKGFKYNDSLGVQDGVQKMLLRSSLVNKSCLSLKGKGPNLPDPVLPLAGPVVVQVINKESNVCWESTF